MNALNEVNKVISNISCHSHLRTRTDDDEWLTCERMAVRGIKILIFEVNNLIWLKLRNGYKRMKY